MTSPSRRLLVGAACGLICLALASPASAQFGLGYGGLGYGGYGAGYGGYGAGFGGYGGGYGLGGPGYGGYGANYGLGGSFGFGAIGYPYGAFAGYAGVPFQASINAYNLGYGNTVGIGLVPPAYVGTGTAGIGPVGIGGTNPLFGLGLSPLAVNNAIAEQALRRPSRVGSPYQQTYGNAGVRYRFAAPGVAPNPAATPTLPNPAPNPAIPGAAPAVPR